MLTKKINMKLSSFSGITKFSIFLIFPLIFSLSCGRVSKSIEKKETTITVLRKHVISPDSIIPITDSLVKPIIYTRAISLDTLSVSVRKQKFFDMMLPAVLVAKTKLDSTRKKVEYILSKPDRTPEEEAYIDSLEIKYKTKNPKELIKRLHALPVSIVLAQAAIESGWGTSRFFKKANNPFGMWSFNDDHAKIAALHTRDGKDIYLRKFKSLEEAIEAYYYMLATRKPYKKLRDLEQKTTDPFILIKGLTKYSERGSAYVAEVGLTIRANNLTKYDSYILDPEYAQTSNSD